MKKVVFGIALFISLFTLSGCGNKDMFQVDYQFSKAIIKLPDGEVIKGDVAVWTSYEHKDMVKVKLKDGRMFLGNSENIVLYND